MRSRRYPLPSPRRRSIARIFLCRALASSTDGREADAISLGQAPGDRAAKLSALASSSPSAARMGRASGAPPRSSAKKAYVVLHTSDVRI